MKVFNFTFLVWREYNEQYHEWWVGRVMLGDEIILDVDLSEHKVFNTREAEDALEYEFAKRLKRVLE